MKGLGEKSGKIAEGLRNASFVKTVIFTIFWLWELTERAKTKTRKTKVTSLGVL